jgi:DNA uptake protein ComE-like DNA-binding protein
MKRIVFTTAFLFMLCGCNANSKTPDQIRQDASDATAAANRGAQVAAADAKAAIQGVKDGLKKPGSVNINIASEAELASLPGMNDLYVRKVIENRPYRSTDELVSRHIISKPEYDRISDHIETQ